MRWLALFSKQDDMRDAASHRGDGDTLMIRRDALSFMRNSQGAIPNAQAIQRMRDIRAQRIARRDQGEGSWIDYAFTDEETQQIYDLCVRNIGLDPFWNDFLAAALFDMERHSFCDSPSVNRRNALDGSHIKLQNTKSDEVKFAILANVDLQAHTWNVCRSIEPYLNKNNTQLTDRDLRLLTLGCLLHDYGKSIPLLKALKLVDGDDLDFKRYDHASYGRIYISRLIEVSFSEVWRSYEQDLNDLAMMVHEHHGNGAGNLSVPISAVLKAIDQRAREEEYQDGYMWYEGVRHGS